ncbi:MAG: DUF2948 family protein [Hyphomicrobiaceae bacterium]|nr:DUF2948 family protein [Hyphomicrobiaceae bacterium]
MPDLKLIALDAEDLAVISAHLQDAVVSVGDLAYLPRDRRFVALANRFDWMDVIGNGKRETDTFARRRAAMRFERVLGAQVQGFDLADTRRVLSLLAISFEPASPPGGQVTLHFADGAAIRLHVECIEAGLADLGAAWETEARPEHPDAPES